MTFVLSEAVATTLAAAIAAAVGLLTLIISKEHTVSEFRQAWINALRDDLAEAISAATTLSTLLQEPFERRSDDAAKERGRLLATLARIDLRLNLDEQKHQQLKSNIEEIESLVNRLDDNPRDYAQSEWLDLKIKSLDASRNILKEEWNRVKSGEEFFKKAKATFSIIAICSVVTMAIFAIFSLVTLLNGSQGSEKNASKVTQTSKALPKPTSDREVKSP